MDDVQDSESTGDFSSASESDFGSQEDLLVFSSWITEELKSHFGRNSGSEDYCDDIYEDKFASPTSGRYSYYEDLLAVAQVKDSAADDGKKLKKTLSKTQKAADVLHIHGTEFHCSWVCSGRRRPSLGAGPLEDLFRVLDCTPCCPVPMASSSSNCALPSSWSLNSSMSSTLPTDVSCNMPIDDDYSNFIDVFYRWNSDVTSGIPSYTMKDFRHFGDY